METSDAFSLHGLIFVVTSVIFETLIDAFLPLENSFRFLVILVNSAYLQYKRITKNLKEFSRGKKHQSRFQK